MLPVASRSLAALMSLACIAAATPAAAVTTPSWNGWKWARSGNLQIAVGDNVSAKWKSYLAGAAATWSADPVIDLTVTAGKTNPSSCGAVSGTIQVCSAAYGFNGWLGYTNVYLQNGYIVSAVVRWNESYFAAAKYNNTSWYSATACHELGHALGLDHPDVIRTNANNGSCLDYTNDVTGLISNGPLSNTAASPGDFAGLAAIYATPAGVQLASTRPTALAGAGLWVEGWTGDTSDTFRLLAAVPEPSSWALLITGFGLVGAMQRRRRSAAA